MRPCFRPDTGLHRWQGGLRGCSARPSIDREEPIYSRGIAEEDDGGRTGNIQRKNRQDGGSESRFRVLATEIVLTDRTIWHCQVRLITYSHTACTRSDREIQNIDVDSRDDIVRWADDPHPGHRPGASERKPPREAPSLSTH